MAVTKLKPEIRRILSAASKKKCDVMGKEKRKEVLGTIFDLETKYNDQLGKLALLKKYFSSVSKKDRDVYKEEKDKMIC